MQAILNFITGPLNTLAWMYILLPCVFVGGLLFTIRNKGIQFSKFGYAMKNTIGKVFEKQEASEGAITPFQAVTTALAATVGTGNIVGTSQAIALGGYGALFWLWIAALLGMIIKYSEVTLSIAYRERNEKGDWVGGPMYYITKGLGQNWKWLAVLFAVFATLASFGIGNLSQANSIVGSINGAITAFPYPQFRPAEAREAGVEAEAQELPYTVISDGRILSDNLTLCGKDHQWLDHYLVCQRISQSDVVLLTVTQSGKTALIRR